MTNLGLRRGIVELIPHQPEWHDFYNQEVASITQSLGQITIEHVGSTAIPGILAKPIIDIAILYETKDQATSWVPLLESLGYEYKGEQGVPNRFFFAKGPEEKRDFYLHVVDAGEFKKLTSFRDILQSNPQLAADYSQLKTKLAIEHANDRKAYTQQKQDFIAKVLQYS